MLMTINEILDALEIRGVVRHYNADRAVAYYGAIWLDDTLPACGANYLYIGRTSRLPAELPGRDIGLLLVNDDGRDLSWMGVDVAELSPDSDIAEICLRVKERFFRTREISAISQSLIEKMFRSQSIREITDLIGEYLGNPVFVTYNFGSRPFFYAGDPTTEREIQTLRDLRGKRTTPEREDLVERVMNSSEPIIVDNGFCYSGKRRMVIGITDGARSNRSIGMLTVFEVRRPFTPMDGIFLSFMGYILSLKADEPSFARELTSQEYTQYLHDLIRGERPGDDREWENALFGTEGRNYLVVLAGIQRLSSLAQEEVRYRLYQSVGFSTILMRGSYLVLIANLRERDAGGILREAEALAGAHGLLFGVSEFFSDIGQLRKYYIQAKRIREIARDTVGESGVLPFGKYKAALLVHNLAATENPELFVDESVDRLIAYDRQKNTEYLTTLETYIRCGMSSERTRSRLRIHRNTLTYRLNRIEEILGHRLDDGDYLLGLYFAHMIRRIVGRRSFSDE